MIPRRRFGNTSDSVSIMGLGGNHLGKTSSASAAVRIVQEAIGAGVTFLDNAWEYHDAESERWMGRAIADRRDAVFLMTKVRTHGRSDKVGLRQLDESLKRLHTDYLDLWQIHECAIYDDPDRHYREGGVVEALASAKSAGKVRYVGFDAQFRSFQSRVLPELALRHIAAIGVKPLGGDGRVIDKRVATVPAALRYAMSLPVCTTVCGVDSLKVLRQDLRIAERFVPMNAGERRAYERTLAPYAADGRFELYKTSAEHEGAVGRKQHGFPSENEVTP